MWAEVDMVTTDHQCDPPGSAVDFVQLLLAVRTQGRDIFALDHGEGSLRHCLASHVKSSTRSNPAHPTLVSHGVFVRGALGLAVYNGFNGPED